jgi:ribonuclease PH
VAQPLGHLGGLLLGGAGQDEAELLAAVAAQQVALAQAGAHALGHRLDDQVAHRVAVAVVEGLEVVDVAHDAAHLAALGQQLA